MPIFGNNKSQVDEVERLRRAVEELSVLNDLARAISVSQDSGEIMRTIINCSVKAITAEVGGRGGGRPGTAQAGLPGSEAIDPALALAAEAVRDALA
ncbi:hypothetical protein KKG45_12895 [bacterium]|nr:hypothetical protein [bacterium]